MRLTMNSNNTGTYLRTSIDAARANYTTIARVGQKRTFDESHVRQKDAKPPDLADITNRAGFRRPPLQDDKIKPIKASAIRDVVDRGSPSEWTQRQRLALAPMPGDNPRLALSHPSMAFRRSLLKIWPLLVSSQCIRGS